MRAPREDVRLRSRHSPVPRRPRQSVGAEVPSQPVGSDRKNIGGRAGVLVVGGGIVGLTLARELRLRRGLDVVVLEKEDRLGVHASGRNSGVLHAGVYYATGGLRAQTCLAGNRLMKAYCRARGIPVVESGKVIVARNEGEGPALEELSRRATANGARVRWLSPQELADVEPRARTVGRALHSLDTAVVDPIAVVESLRAELTALGVTITTRTRFLGLAGPGVARTNDGPVRFDRLVNAAGAHADVVARCFGLAAHLRMIPFKGIYYRLRKDREVDVRSSIYPVPDLRNPFLGVHFTRNARGELYLGPTAIPAFGRENYGLLAGADREALRIIGFDLVLLWRNAAFRAVAMTEPRKYVSRWFHRDASRLVVGHEPTSYERAKKVGIRPQLVDWKTKQLLMDFLVEARDGSVHVLNPISPAFTASMEMARRIVDDHFA